MVRPGFIRKRNYVAPGGTTSHKDKIKKMNKQSRDAIGSQFNNNARLRKKVLKTKCKEIMKECLKVEM